MRFTTTFEQVQDQVGTDDQEKWDITTDRRTLLLQNGKLLLPQAYCNGHAHDLAPTPWATTQLCQRLGMPVPYYKKCPTWLQDAQFNYWVRMSELNSLGGEAPASRRSNGFRHEEEPGSTKIDSTGEGLHEEIATQRNVRTPRRNPPVSDNWLLRAKGATLRGVLSDRYAPLDNGLLLNCVSPLLEDHYQVDWFDLGDESLHLRLVDPSRHHQVLPDDNVMVGIHIANSEVGKRAVTVDAVVYRLICSNGMIRLVKGKSLLHQRHIHLASERFKAALESALYEAKATATLFIEQLTKTTQEQIPDVEETIKRIGHRWSLSQTVQDAVKQALLRERSDQQESLYGLLNAFTSVAQQLPPDDRYHLEVLAGQLVEHGVPHTLLPQSPSVLQAKETQSRPLSQPQNGSHSAATGSAEMPSAGMGSPCMESSPLVAHEGGALRQPSGQEFGVPQMSEHHDGNHHNSNYQDDPPMYIQSGGNQPSTAEEMSDQKNPSSRAVSIIDLAKDIFQATEVASEEVDAVHPSAPAMTTAFRQ